MGKIIELNTKTVAPIQQCLFVSDLVQITRSYFREPQKMLVPVRKHPFYNDRHSLLDGHHSTCIADTLNDFQEGFVKIFGYEVNNNHDFIDANEIPDEFYIKNINDNNRNIKLNFLDTQKYLKNWDLPESIEELRSKYSRLESAIALINCSFPDLNLTEDQIQNLYFNKNL